MKVTAITAMHYKVHYKVFSTSEVTRSRMKSRFWVQNEVAFAEKVFVTENRNIVVFPRLVDAMFGERIVAVNVPVYFNIFGNTYLLLPM
ncbi:hypothetical protein B4U80_03631 [Leptotrombidium deliense]|uniref:Uncharacterized protein n=1 Tax=Leptotrombidium deliense TaxID=299467 RepID=A0A443RZS2_9ACAR|nr:hypothetical protein B4U80_03631 [Leptotrombidium deliense]